MLHRPTVPSDRIDSADDSQADFLSSRRPTRSLWRSGAVLSAVGAGVALAVATSQGAFGSTGAQPRTLSGISGPAVQDMVEAAQPSRSVSINASEADVLDGLELLHSDVRAARKLAAEQAAEHEHQAALAQQAVERARLGVLAAQAADRAQTARAQAATALRARAASSARVTRSAARDPRAVARLLVADHGWSSGQFDCLSALWQKESGWNPSARNASSGAFGIPQALPGSKMASIAGDWRTNPVTQIKWGLSYIAGRYGTPCGAWAHSQAHNWY